MRKGKVEVFGGEILMIQPLGRYLSSLTLSEGGMTLVLRSSSPQNVKKGKPRSICPMLYGWDHHEEELCRKKAIFNCPKRCHITSYLRYEEALKVRICVDNV